MGGAEAGDGGSPKGDRGDEEERPPLVAALADREPVPLERRVSTRCSVRRSREKTSCASMGVELPRSLMISTKASYSSSRSLTINELNSESVRGCPMEANVSARPLTLL